MTSNSYHPVENRAKRGELKDIMMEAIRVNSFTSKELYEFLEEMGAPGNYYRGLHNLIEARNVARHPETQKLYLLSKIHPQNTSEPLAYPERPKGNGTTATSTTVNMGKPIVGQPNLVPRNAATERMALSDFNRNRSGRIVSLEYTPSEFTDVARLQFCHQGQWITVPLFGNIRVCIGNDIPRWDPAQETYYRITSIRIIYMTERVEEFGHNGDLPITVAPY